MRPQTEDETLSQGDWLPIDWAAVAAACVPPAAVFAESMRQARDQILGAFGVPASVMLGDPDAPKPLGTMTVREGKVIR